MPVPSSWDSIHRIAGMTDASGASIGAWRNGIKRKWFGLTAAHPPIRVWSRHVGFRSLCGQRGTVANKYRRLWGHRPDPVRRNPPNPTDLFQIGDNNVTHRPDLLLCRTAGR